RAPVEYFGQRVIFQADISFFQSIKELTTVLGLISPVMIISPSTAPNIYQQVKDLLFSISKDYNEANSLYEATIYMKLLEMFILIGRDYINYQERFINSKFQKQQEYADKFIFVCNYITEHCTEDLSLDEVARIAGFSKYHFSRLFKQFTDETFYKYLNQRRIEYAERLLANSEFSVTEVALQAGFPSLSAFIRMFKLSKQCTPTEFRSMHKPSLDIPPASYENIISE
ncbi:MAG: helix-turn-helix transcriptional regulator, partial [Lachnospiraceae bacterium]|nr:helix-turn-helix transcriptional regulator [Lachnospiraceae bacterium]